MREMDGEMVGKTERNTRVGDSLTSEQERIRKPHALVA
jgi:hypothetical protein